jgi:hypothetical protein
MSQATQTEFFQYVNKYYTLHKHLLPLSTPEFEKTGFVSSAIMRNADGQVKILCGPPEYHSEIFISVFRTGKRFALRDLMTIPKVRDWIVKFNKTAPAKDKCGIELEVEWAFLILIECLRGISDFSWLHN